MLKTAAIVLIGAALMFSAPAFAIDGQILINQSTVMAAGGFPYKITQPGSYKLSGNLVVTNSYDAIDINSDDVTLDLNGFAISCNDPGQIRCSSTYNLDVYEFSDYGGITSSHNNITITNGTIRGFIDGAGVVMKGSGGLLSDLKLTGNSTGIAARTDIFGQVPVVGFVITRCYAIGNFHVGIAAAQSTVTASVANNNHYAGFADDAGGSVFINNVANGNYIGLETSNDLYGGNNFNNNNGAPVNKLGGSVSQNNNSCNGAVC